MLNKFLPFLIICLFAAVLVSLWFKDGYIMGTAEGGIPFYDLGRYYDVTKDAWTDFGLGNSTGTITASKVTYGFLSIVESAGVPGYLTQALFIFFMLISSGVGVFLLVKEVDQKITNFTAIFGVFFYWFNPISLVNTWNRFLINHIVFFAFLPLALFFYLKGLRERKLYYSVFLGVLSIVYSYVFISPAFSILLWCLLFLTSTIFCFLEPKSKQLVWFYLTYFFLNLFVFILFNFWWISPLLSFYALGTYQASTSTFFTTYGNVSALTDLSQRLGQFFNNLRFIHGDFFVSENSWREYYNSIFVVILGYLVLAIIFYGLFKGRKVKGVLLFGLVFVLSLFLMAGNQYPFGDFFQFAFVNIPTLQVFRNPFEKFGFIFVLSSTVLFVYGLNSLMVSPLTRLMKISVIGLLTVLVVLFWGYPYWSGVVFTSIDAPSNQNEVGYKVTVPGYYKEVDSWFKMQGDNYRVLVLPIGDEGITHIWSKGYSGIDITYALLSTPAVSFNSTIPNYYDFVERIKYYQLSPKILEFARFANFRYILWRGDIDYQLRGIANPVDVKSRLEDWTKQGLLIKRLDKGLVVVYEIAPAYLGVPIYSSSNIVYSDDVDLINILSISKHKDNLVVVKSSDRREGQKGQEIISPVTVFSPEITQITSNYSEQEILDRFLHVKHLPGGFLYNLSQVKEILQTPSRSDSWKWAFYKFSILGKRAVEIYKLKKEDPGSSEIIKTEQKYLSELKEFIPTLKEMVKLRNGVWDEAKDSIIMQVLLLKSVNSRVFSEAESLLTELNIKPYFDLPELAKEEYTIYNFTVSNDDNYHIVIDSTYEVNQWYVDGRVQQDILKNNHQIFLTKGVHEIAIVNNSAADYNIIVEPKLVFNQNSIWKKRVEFQEIPTAYKIEFDYRFYKGREFAFHIIQNTSSKLNDRLVITKDEFDHQWRHYDKVISSRAGAVSAQLSLSTTTNEICNNKFIWTSKCIEVINKFDVELNNFRLAELKRPAILLVSSSPVDKSDQVEIRFKKQSQTLYEVEVNKKSIHKEVLVFSELYNTGWKLVDQKSLKVTPFQHILVNGYANGWVIDQTGEYHLLIKYSPQENVIISNWVSVIAVVSSILAVAIIKRNGNH